MKFLHVCLFVKYLPQPVAKLNAADEKTTYAQYCAPKTLSPPAVRSSSPLKGAG